MTTPEHRTHTITDELAHLRETPHLGLPREQVLGMAMAARALASGMRAARERRGRAGWSDAEHAARLELAADANGLDRLTPAQALQWNQRVAAGDITTHQHGPSGMTISFADLDDHTQIVQATLDVRTVTVAAGSADMGARVRSWLAESPSHDSLNELRDVARDIADDKVRVHLENSRADTATAGPDEQAETRGRNDAEAQERRELADRLGDRVPDRVTGHPSWARAEKQFDDLVAGGADPGTLADAVAGLRFTEQVRSPAGLAMWQMRKTAAGQPGPSDEDTARREAATEWLTTEALDTPADRARATRLIGQFDDAFDAQLADKYPGLLSVDDAHIADHIARADTNTDAAAEHDETVRVDEHELATIAPPAVDGALDRGTEHTDIALEYGQSVDHEHTAAAERDFAENAEADRTRHAADHLTDERAAERAAAAPSHTADGSPVRTANPRPRRGGPSRAPQQNTNRRARTR